MIRLKNAEQIAGIRASCLLLSETLDALRPIVKSGIATAEIDEFTRSFIVSRGGRPAFLGYQGYPASICISVNDEVIHGIPGKRRLEDGDLVGLDCGIDLDGFFSDAAITLPVGDPGAEARELLETTRACLDAAIAAIRPGGRIHDISRAVYRLATEKGYGVVRDFCGHGVGFSPHEDPQVPNYASPGPNPRMMNGMVLAIEPMINLGTGDVTVLEDGWTVVTDDGKPSAHFEHTVAIVDGKAEVLTRW